MFYLRTSSAHLPSLRRFAAPHPLTIGTPCPACGLEFQAGEACTLVPIGPGHPPDARERARGGLYYPAVALQVHWPCATGDESPPGPEPGETPEAQS